MTTKFLIWQPNAYGQRHNNYYFITALVLTRVPFVAPSSIITTDTLKPEISSHVPEVTLHKRNYIVHLHENISATSSLIRDMAQPTEVTLYFPSSVPSQAGLAIINNDGVSKCEEWRVVVYVVLECACCVQNTLCETNKSPSCLCCGGSLFATVSLYNAGSSVTNYGAYKLRKNSDLLYSSKKALRARAAFKSAHRQVLGCGFPQSCQASTFNYVRNSP
jgi:hypothetical protein